MAKTCSVNDCDGKHDAKGFCKKHYSRFRRYGNPLYIPSLDEIKKKISKNRRGIIPSLETRKKMSESMKKRKQNENSLEALRKANIARIGTKRPQIGKKVSESLKKKWKNPEFKNKMKTVRQKQFSNPKTKAKISESLKKLWKNPEYKTHQSKSHKGIIAGMLGKKHSEETRKKISQGISKESRKKLSELHKAEKNPMYGKPSWNRGKSTSEETKRKQRERVQKWLSEHPEFREQASERRSKQKFPFKDSKSVELKIQKILDEYNIQYKKHHVFKLESSYHPADILIEPNLVIEGFGDYWHFNPKKYDGESIQQKRRKEIKVKDVWKYDKYVIDGMKKQGYKVLVIWESELKNELEETAKKILRFIKNNQKKPF